jgi:hypothetical protein
MSEVLSSSPNHGRIIRAALIIFPVGTVILGIGSFGIWWFKKAKVEERNFKYAMALRRDLSEAGIKRYEDVLKDVLRQPDAQKIPAVAAYLESSMGGENMGYQVRRDRFQFEPVELANVDVELSTKKRFRDVVLLLVPYGDASRLEEESRAISLLMSLAHAITGESGSCTLRLAVVPAGLDKKALERFVANARAKDERFMQVFVAGGVPDAMLSDVKTAFRVEETGTVVTSLPDTGDTANTFLSAQALKTRLLKAIE